MLSLRLVVVAMGAGLLLALFSSLVSDEAILLIAAFFG